MTKILVLLLLIFCVQSFSDNGVTEQSFYGKEIKTEKAIPLDTVLNNYSEYENKDVVMEASVEKVCAKKGCWMTLQGSEKIFRVKFHDYSFFVPMSLVGQKVWVEGLVKKKILSIGDTQHYLKDAGASPAEIAAVKKPSVEYSIVAKGVRVVN